MNYKNPGELLLDENKIARRVKELAKTIEADYGEKDLLLICVLRGAFIFTADLVKNIEMPLAVDFMAVSSYGSSTKSSGVVRILKDLDIDIRGKNVLLVEDIIDTGLTVQYLVRNLKSREPENLEICALLVKENNNLPINIKYKGFDIPRSFVVGYGLDINERFRNLRAIYKLEE